MFARAARNQALRVMRTPSIRRTMCTAAESEKLSPLSLKKPEVQGFIACSVAIYIGALRWQSIDRKMAKQAAEQASHHHAEKAHHEEVEILHSESLL